MQSVSVIRSFVLIVTVFAATVLAQDPSGLITVERLIDLALVRNAGLLAVRERAGEARGALSQAGLRPNPTLDVGAANGAVLGSGGENEYSLAYSHTLETGGKRDLRLESGRLSVALAEAEAADFERGLRWRVRAAFAEALAARRSLGASERLLALNDQSLQIARARAEIGEGSPLERSLVEVEGNRLKADRLLFAGQLDRALLELKALAGIRLDEPLDLNGALPAPRIVLAPDEAIQQALANRADLAAAQLQVRVARAGERAARSEAIPNLVLTGRFTHSTARFDQYGLAAPDGPAVPLRDADRMLGAGVTINLPVRNRNQGAIQSAAAQVRRAQYETQAAEREIRAEVAAALHRYQTARSALELFDESVVRQSEEHVQVLRSAYDLGEIRLLDVLSEQRRLVETQKSYTEILKEGYVALSGLERAIGKPLF